MVTVTNPYFESLHFILGYNYGFVYVKHLTLGALTIYNVYLVHIVDLWVSTI